MTDIPALPPSRPTPGPTSGIGVDTSRLASRANLEKAGKQFESVFAGMMLKSMRQAHLAEELFSSKGLDTFRDMQDQQVAQSMADHAPLGIGKAMTDFLAKSQANLQPESTSKPAGETP
ncbi:rod-binding protein [Sphingomonas sp. QA11]|uniref:rod-binding protein n=1 Tax=Sphingomonas sp. QA11 TaxID=2950605 RepID=UPI00234B7BDE|nr:rod-binding protein [Sphingomonas sp. QA11]WCM26589.1 rod-binding protein [Sphingomonas sp. QA11]